MAGVNEEMLRQVMEGGGLDMALEPPSAYEPPTETALPLAYPWDVPVEPGWYPEAEMQEYLSWPIVSASHSVQMTHHGRRTPAYLKWSLHSKHEDDDSIAKSLGSLAHTAILEPDLLTTEYIVEPEPDPEVYRTGDGKVSSKPKSTTAWKEAIAELEATGKKVVSADAYAKALEIRDQIHRHPRASKIIKAQGYVEASGVAVDPDTGLMIKIRPDKLVDALGYNVNVKTSANAQEEAFSESIYRFAYYVSAAFYEIALRSLGFDHRKSIIIAADTAGPKEVAVWDLDYGTMDAGHNVVRDALRKIARCVERDEWPGYSVGVEHISLPPWAWNKIDQAVAGVAY